MKANSSMFMDLRVATVPTKDVWYNSNIYNIHWGLKASALSSSDTTWSTYEVNIEEYVEFQRRN